jgi:hypothetical protein
MKSHKQIISSLTLAGLVAFLSACASTNGGASASASIEQGAANTVAQADAPASAHAAVDDPRVCERIIPTGTRIAQRVCFKQSEWDQMRENAQMATQDSQRRAVQQGNPTGN